MVISEESERGWGCFEENILLEDDLNVNKVEDMKTRVWNVAKPVQGIQGECSGSCRMSEEPGTFTFISITTSLDAIVGASSLRAFEPNEFEFLPLPKAKRNQVNASD